MVVAAGAETAAAAVTAAVVATAAVAAEVVRQPAVIPAALVDADMGMAVVAPIGVVAFLTQSAASCITFSAPPGGSAAVAVTVVGVAAVLIATVIVAAAVAAAVMAAAGRADTDVAMVAAAPVVASRAPSLPMVAGADQPLHR